MLTASADRAERTPAAAPALPATATRPGLRLNAGVPRVRRVVWESYEGGIPAARITDPHREISLARSAPIYSGDTACSLTPDRPRRSLTCGDSSATRTALFSVSSTARGVPAGAASAFQELTE